EVHLVVHTEPARPASMEVLRDALDAKLESFTGIASIFIKNLDTGQELCYNCNLAFSGVSLLKIPIILQRYRQLDAAPDAETLSLIKAALTESDNAAANLILQQIGAGNPYTGALQVTDFVRQLGLENTFLAAPYDLKDGIPLPNFSTPANSQTAFNTEPDPYIQTTALEMGLLMEGLGQCAEGVGMLRLIFPREITPAECEDILNIMEHNQVTELLEAGMPPGVPVAHKNGWTGQTHADVALAATPNGRVVIAAFLYQPEWLVWEESAPLFADLGRLTYRFFNGETE
ncbi:MAG TPA: class A beta-lactamase-related serine hydrolase, partial [Anaerolineae bacterium]|nr:class A beta-lactamase-related serine hydrolase [Anaerolineae bacterium]